QVQMLDRIARQALQQLEELLAAEGLVVKAAEQAHLRPGAFIAPGGGGYRLVNGSTQHVACGHDLAAVAAVLQGMVLEQANLGAETVLETVQILRLIGVLQPNDLGQQRSSEGDQWIQTGIEASGIPPARRIHHALLDLLHARGRAEIGQGRLRRRLAAAVEDDGTVVLAVFHILDHGGQFLMAQNLSSSPGKSPETWKAKPPERSSWASSSEWSSRA